MPRITHTELDDMLIEARAGIDASDLHGSLAGYLCGGGIADARHWLDALALAYEGEALPEFCARLYAECAAHLADPGFVFTPLLPPEDTPLAARADALGAWCQGFLGGIGLAGAAHAGAMSADAREILGDFDTIAATSFDDTDSEEAEAAFAEVIEFVRVGAILLHTELTPPAPGGATVH
jgi:uncharacterized protein YgfB (UPF0149 family)